MDKQLSPEGPQLDLSLASLCIVENGWMDFHVELYGRDVQAALFWHIFTQSF